MKLLSPYSLKKGVQFYVFDNTTFIVQNSKNRKTRSTNIVGESLHIIYYTVQNVYNDTGSDIPGQMPRK